MKPKHDDVPTGAPQENINLRGLQLLLVVIGLFVSGYLSYLKISNEVAVCVESGPFDCNVVLNSIYSELAGIPIAWLGIHRLPAHRAGADLGKAGRLYSRLRQPAGFRHRTLRLALFHVADLCPVRPAGRALSLVPHA